MRASYKLFPAVSLLFVLALLFNAFAGCSGQAPETDPEPSVPVEPVITEQGGIYLAKLTANDAMRYNADRFNVPAGAEVRLTLVNIGTKPRMTNGHNWVLLPRASDPYDFIYAEGGELENSFIPTDWQDKVIAHTRVLGPGQSETITFTAPSEPGEYPFICSFPAHFESGMKGVMVVTANEQGL